MSAGRREPLIVKPRRSLIDQVSLITYDHYLIEQNSMRLEHSIARSSAARRQRDLEQRFPPFYPDLFETLAHPFRPPVIRLAKRRLLIHRQAAMGDWGYRAQRKHRLLRKIYFSNRQAFSDSEMLVREYYARARPRK